jgi:hypothetical protein
MKRKLIVSINDHLWSSVDKTCGPGVSFISPRRCLKLTEINNSKPNINDGPRRCNSDELDI